MKFPFFTKVVRLEDHLKEFYKIISDEKFISVRIDERVKAIGTVTSAEVVKSVSNKAPATELEFLEAFNDATDEMQIMFGKHITAQA